MRAGCADWTHFGDNSGGVSVRPVCKNFRNLPASAYPKLFRASLDAAGIGGDYGPADADGHREYYRVLTPQDIESFDLADTFDTLFSGSVVLCSLRATPPAESAGAAYVRSLKEHSHLSFCA